MRYAEPLSDRLQRGVLPPEAQRRVRAAYAGLDPDRSNATGPLLNDEMIWEMRRHARDEFERDIAAVARLSQHLAVAAGKIKPAVGNPGDPAQRFAEHALGEAFEASAERRRGRTKFVAEVIELLQSPERTKNYPPADG